MFTNRTFYLLIIVTMLVVTACSPQIVEKPTGISAQSKPITLRLAVSDGDASAPSGPYVHEFVNQVKTLSNGNITIEPVWGAGDTTEVGFERGVIQLVRDSKFDLGIAASRAFDNDKDRITSFQALQTPFLIDNDALAVAMATSEVATRMLDNLASVGLAGLTLWPEDLRHPFSVDPSKPILSPEDFTGMDVRTTDTSVDEMLIKALGGTPIFEASDYQGAESGLRQGASLTGTPTATGNVTFFAKYQVLFANGTAYKKLSDEQRTVLQQAAVATQKKALAEHPSDAEAGTTWCADGGSIALASNEQVVAFQKAAQPVFDKLQKDSFNAESIGAIHELKANTQPSPGAQACAPTVAIPTQASAENQTWSPGLPPNGVWQAEITTDDFVRMGLLRSVAQSDWAGSYMITFDNGKFIFDWRGEQSQTGKCQAGYELVGDVVHLTYTSLYNCENPEEDIQWRIDNDGLHLHLVAQKGDFVGMKAFFEAKTWQKVEEWSTGLPPNGVWQVELTADDFVRMGVLKSNAKDLSGQQTYEFQDGEGTFRRRVNNVEVEICPFTYKAVENFVRLSFHDTGLGHYDCGNDHDDVQWRLDTDGLHFHLVDTTATKVEITAIYEAKPWQKIP